MKKIVLLISVICLFLILPGCGKKAASEGGIDMELQQKAEQFLSQYLTEMSQIELRRNAKAWEASNSGKKEDFDATALENLKLKKMHSDAERYNLIESFLKQKDKLKPLTARSLEVAHLAFKGNQLSEEILKKLVDQSTEIEKIYINFRGKLDGKPHSNNQLLSMLAAEKDSSEREEIWNALKEVGEALGPKLVELAKLRNEAAKTLGYQNFWEMKIKLQDHIPEEIVQIFNDLEKMTDEPFKKMKEKLDRELATRLNIKPEEMKPWHYDNPFFQEAPPSAAVDLDEFFKNKKKEDIVAIAQKFFTDINLPVGQILAHSDLYERDGKDQHAFSSDIDRKGDTRILVNIKPSVYWMDTLLHELGHAVYAVNQDFSLPFNLIDAAHAFTTEGVAMLLGALAKNPQWIITYAGADSKQVKELENAILEQRQREQLIFARWSLVMVNFEKHLYENPDQDLNKLWWDMKKRYQFINPPENRNKADWAAKPHFTIAPVYYHNYQLGELFAAQIRNTLVKLAKHDGPAHTLQYNHHPEFGQYLKDKVFKPASKYPWPKFVTKATGEPLTPKYFAAELQ